MLFECFLKHVLLPPEYTENKQFLGSRETCIRFLAGPRRWRRRRLSCKIYFSGQFSNDKMCFGDLFWGGRFGRLGWTAATAMATAELQNRLFKRILERNAVWWPSVFFYAVLVVWAGLRIPSCQNIVVYLKSLRRRRETILIAQLFRTVSLCT